MAIRRLIFSEIAPGASFHAAHALFPTAAYPELPLHRHDFYEWILAVAGSAAHLVNAEWGVLHGNQLALIRPEDAHALAPVSGKSIEFINIAFPTNVWADFVRATGLEAAAAQWESSPMPPVVDLLDEQARRLRAEGLAACKRFHDDPSQLAFSSFWAAAAEALVESGRSSSGRESQPIWLRGLVQWSEAQDASALSLSGLVEASGVSGAHLSRTMKRFTGVTPTQFINDLRIRQAAYSIANSDEPLASVALDCGFDSLSYFYRRFRSYYGKTPLRYRYDSKRSLKP